MQSQSVTGITVTKHCYEKYSTRMWDCSITKLPFSDFLFLQNFKVHNVESYGQQMVQLKRNLTYTHEGGGHEQS